MVHLTIKAASVATDKGMFTAYAATWSIDRDGDQIVKGAFAKTIRRWQQSGKALPVHWNHSGEASDVIGSIDPASMVEREEALRVSGQLDLKESETAREAWRSMKSNAVSLSFGFMIVKSRDREDGIRELQQIDLFEVSIVPAPSNPETRFTELKSATTSSSITSAEEFARIISDPVPTMGTEERRMEQDIEHWAKQAKGDEEKAAKRARPVLTKTFKC
jgi:Escherichia/Staphylococcus phage prohead protease